MKQANSFTSSTSSFSASTLSIPSALAQSTNPGSSDSVFEELVSKLFSCRILLVSTESAQQYVSQTFDGIGLVDIFNQFSQLSGLNSIIRDLSGSNAYAFKKIRYRFFDVEQFKVRMNDSQVKKSQLEIVSSMQETCNLSENNLTTPWYSSWRNHYIDNYEKSDHDFIGSSCGCFFIITKDELPHYRPIFEKLCASVKQMSNLNFVQADFVRYFIVLSNEEITPASQYGQYLQALSGDFPNSFILNISQEVLDIVQEQKKSPHAMFSIGDDEMPANISRSETVVSDPLSEIQSQNQNSSFYNQLVSQRAQQQQSQLAKSSNSSSEKNEESLTSGNESLATKKLDENLLYSLCQALTENIQQLLREFTNKSLVPWAERQIKFLGEAISQRKGIRKSLFNATKSILNMSSSSLSKAITGGSGNQSGVYYVPDAQEMRQRKLADICMVFGLYEMAISLYYSARKDFQSENAWIYFAGACEMYAISSYFINKFSPNYLDQAISTYLEHCKNIKLATRIAILVTELNCQLGRFNEAANIFIRLTGDDSDLRSALFLEQASKCFLLASKSPELLQVPPNEWIDMALTKDKDSCVFHGSRFRKAAFHYILAGHRFNRCGLKHFALACYEKFSYPSWEAASDHVNLTVSRLSIMLPNQASENFTTHYLKGLEIYRENSHKALFFNELMKEFKKIRNNEAKIDEESLKKLDMYNLNFPSVIDLFIISIDSLRPVESFAKGKATPRVCFVGETLELAFQLCNAFPVALTDVKLLCSHSEFDCFVVESVNFEEENSCVNILLKIVPNLETEFEILGLEFSIDNIRFRSSFSVDKFKKPLSFKATKSLPLIPLEIGFKQFRINNEMLKKSSSTAEMRQNIFHVPVPVYASEEFSFEIHCNLSNCGIWRPSSMKLFSDSRKCYSWPEVDNKLIDAHEDLHSEALALDNCDRKEHLVNATLDDGPFMFKVHIPPKVSQHVISFRLLYSDADNEQREIVRKILFDVQSCLSLEMRLDQVITVKNLFVDSALSFFDVSIGEQESDAEENGEMLAEQQVSYSVSVPNDQLAHLLLLKNSLRWSMFDSRLATSRSGLVSFEIY